MTDKNTDWDALLKPFNEATEISYEKVTPKKTRTIDVKEFVKEPVVASMKDDMVTSQWASVFIRKGLLNLAKYGILVKNSIIGLLLPDYEIHRQAIMVENEEGRLYAIRD